MGSMIEINDTLQITKEQGFPAELDIERHLQQPYQLADVENKVFTFTEKPAIRVFQQPPVRNFLAENRNGKWIYWGKCFILTTQHDYEKRTTSGTFKIIHLNTLEEMKQAQALLNHEKPELDYFA